MPKIHNTKILKLLMTILSLKSEFPIKYFSKNLWQKHLIFHFLLLFFDWIVTKYLIKPFFKNEF